MKGNNWVKFVVVALLFFAVITVVFTGFDAGFFKAKNLNDMRKGIDIRGGVSAKLEAEGLEREPTVEELKSVKAMIEKRLDSENLFDYYVSVDETNKRVLVEIPWAPGDDTTDATALIDRTINRSKLTFYVVSAAEQADIDLFEKYKAELDKVNEDYLAQKITKEESKQKTLEIKAKKKYKDVKDIVFTDDNNSGMAFVREGDEIINGRDHIASATTQLNEKNKPYVSLEFKDEGRKRFADGTGQVAPSDSTGKYLGILMDDTVISYPSCDSRIDSEGCSIEFGSSDVDKEEVTRLAERIDSGSLPFSVQVTEIRVIGAQLGESAFNVTLYALFAALLIVILFMVVLYRLPGLVCGIALAGNVALTLLFIINVGITVTLPGMAGIILSIGMAVDANVIIFERLKEELKAGKTIRAAVDAGFKRAFAAIFDGNISALITGYILWYFGTGAIKSFAITTIVGVMLSFVTAMTATRIMLQGLTDFDVVKNPGLFGVSKKKKEVEQ